MKWLKKILTDSIKLIYSVVNFKNKIINPDFNLFLKTEYNNVKPEDIKDLERLNYLRRIELSKHGYINKSINDLIKYYNLKNKYHNKNKDIKPVGNIRINMANKLQKQIVFGYDQNVNKLFMSHNNIDFIPIWKEANTNNLNQHLSTLYPDNEHQLNFTSKLFIEDVGLLDAEILDSVLNRFNQAIEQGFNTNKYFKQGIKPMSQEYISNSDNVGKNVSIHFDNNSTITYLTIREINDDYITFQPLFNTALKENTIILNKEEINSILFKNKIDVISKLDHNLLLGSKSGKLFIGQLVNHTNETIWKSYNQFKTDDAIDDHLKVYISKDIIIDKNFFKEKNKMTLNQGNITAIIKQHYGNGKFYFTQLNQGKLIKENVVIDTKIHSYIQKVFEKTPNINTYLKAKSQEKKNINPNIITQ